MSMLFVLLACAPFQGPAAAPNDILELSPRRVSHDNPREVASAQVPLGLWEPASADASGQRVLRFSYAGREVVLAWEPDPEGLSPGRLRRLDAEPSPVLDLEADEDSADPAEISLKPFGMEAHLRFFEQPTGWKGILRTLYHFQAEANIGGKRHSLAWIDMDLDGQASKGDSWIALGAEHFRGLRLGNAMFLANAGDEPWYFGDRVLRLQGPGEGGAVRLRWSKADQPRHEFLRQRAKRIAKRFYEGYDETRASFLESYGIDPARPQAADPLDWYYTHDFRDAQAYAKRAGRPLYVEFTSDGCPWCGRLSWLNYKDAAVAQALRPYALVKLDVDLDPEGTAAQLGLLGVPNSVLFDANGEPLHVFRGWNPPADQVAALVAIQQQD